MNPEQPVLDAIDALVDEQLEHAEKLTTYPKCPRCKQPWHGLPQATCPGSTPQGALVKYDPEPDELLTFIHVVKTAIKIAIDQLITGICGSAAAASAVVEALHGFGDAVGVSIATEIAFDQACATEIAASEDDIDDQA